MNNEGYNQTLGALLQEAPSWRKAPSWRRAPSLRLEGEITCSLDIESTPRSETPEAPQGDAQGAYLTWEDLWVTASDSKGSSHSILSGATGYAEPGQVLAIMGPSGCGKSTLLDALAERLQSNTCRSGVVLVNGQKQKLAFGNSAYVTQENVLMTTLTVREAVYYSAQLQLPDSMPMSEKKERVEKTIEEMGLQDSMETRIGGYGSRGLSGGQKRRVSICIEILTHPKLLFLDEPTSGLDSAASFHVMNRIVGLAQREGMTIISSIHQPSSEVFELFNNICLLSSGKTIYFGPTLMANEFFAANGFPCPSMRNPSDHFLRIVNKDFDKEADEANTEMFMSAANAINILVSSYKVSRACMQVIVRISEINKLEGRKLKKGSQASFRTQCIVLTKRSFLNMYRDVGYYWFRLGMYIALCVCLGTLFHDIGHSYGSIQARGSMLFFTSGFLTFMAIGGFPSFAEDMKIFERERLNGHYSVSAFVVGNTLSSAPYLALISIVPGATAYFPVGLQRSFQHFAFFSLVLYTSMLLVESLMMTIASIVPNYLVGIIAAAGVQGVMLMCGGFFRLPNDIPKPVWRYPIYHLAFHKYANGGYYKNEFIGLSFPNNQANGPPVITGEEVVSDFWHMDGYSKWIDLLVLLVMVVVYRALFLIIVKINERFKPLIKAAMALVSKKPVQVIEHPPTPIVGA